MATQYQALVTAENAVWVDNVVVRGGIIVSSMSKNQADGCDTGCFKWQSY